LAHGFSEELSENIIVLKLFLVQMIRWRWRKHWWSWKD